MTDIEKIAREYAEREGTVFDDDNIQSTADLDLQKAFLAGASYALGNQWRDAEEALPEWNKDVVVASQVPDESEIIYCVGYYNQWWHLEDDGLDAIGEILAWLPIPEYKPKKE